MSRPMRTCPVCAASEDELRPFSICPILDDEPGEDDEYCLDLALYREEQYERFQRLPLDEQREIRERNAAIWRRLGSPRS